MKQLTIREAADFLLRNDNYVLLTHRRPDGDTIGSAAALCAGLRSLGKTAHVLENPQFTEKFRPWLGKLTCETLPSSACVVSVDIAAENLLPFDLPDCAVELQIDHHAGNRQFGLQAFVDASAAACGEIILRLLQLMGVKLDASMGAALYVAISTDTGCFRFNNTTADTLRCAAACKDTGADTFAINTALFMTKRLPRLQLEARLTEEMEFYAGGAVAVNTLPNVLLVELGLTEDDVTLVNMNDDSAYQAFVSGEADLAKTSYPTTDNYDPEKYVTACGMATLGVPYYDNILCSRAFFEDASKHDALVSFIVQMIRTAETFQDDDVLMQAMLDYYEFCGVSVDAEAIRHQVLERPYFTYEQLKTTDTSASFKLLADFYEQVENITTEDHDKVMNNMDTTILAEALDAYAAQYVK